MLALCPLLRFLSLQMSGTCVLLHYECWLEVLRAQEGWDRMGVLYQVPPAAAAQTLLHVTVLQERRTIS